VQDNQSFSSKGVLRVALPNLFTLKAKLVRVLSGEVLDVVVDLRPESVTRFGGTFCRKPKAVFCTRLCTWFCGT
jgi:dTDP-4-dehydrorhamnose 3,5-epimerase-like enzyme